VCTCISRCAISRDNRRGFAVNIDRSVFLAFVASMAGGACLTSAVVSGAQATGRAAAAIAKKQTGGQNAAQAPVGPPVAVVAGVDVLGVRIGMPSKQAIAVLKTKGVDVPPSPAHEGGLEGGGPNLGVRLGVTWTISPQLVHSISLGEQKPMLEATILSTLRAKYGALGTDVGSSPSTGFARAPTKESCLKGLIDKKGDCKANLARRKDSDPQHLQACLAEQWKDCEPYPFASMRPLTEGHAIAWHYDEHGHPLSEEALRRYCPRAPVCNQCQRPVAATPDWVARGLGGQELSRIYFQDRETLEIDQARCVSMSEDCSRAPTCKVVTVLAQFDASIAGGGTVPGGFSVRLWSDWLPQYDNDEQRRLQAEAQAAAEKKRREDELNAARQNQPQL